MVRINTNNAVIPLFACLVALVAALNNPARAMAPHAEAVAVCRTQVETYCRLWMEDRYDAMHAMLALNGLGRMDGEAFLKAHRVPAEQGAGPVRFNIGEAVRIAPERLTMEVFLEFPQTIPPRVISGKHRFHMVNTGDGWRIHHITPPLAPPDGIQPTGGSAPGM